jgi:hypothetical protein
MSALWENCLLLAARTRMDDLVSGLGSGFREKHARYTTTEVVSGMLGLIVLALLVWLATQGIRRLIHRLRSGRGWLFLRLCQAHGLKWSDRWLLWRLTRYQLLRDPARLFVDPDRWEPSRLDPRLPVDRVRLTALWRRVFCDLPGREKASLAPAARPTIPPVAAATANSNAPAGAPRQRTPAAPIVVAPVLDVNGLRDSLVGGE